MEEKVKRDKPETFELLQLQARKTPAKGKKGTKGTKGDAASNKKSAGGKKRGTKDRSDDEDVGSDDSLNEFVVDDDEDLLHAVGLRGQVE
jgi:hypothetical protein